MFFSLNIKGIDDGVWEKRVFTFIELRLLEHGIEFVENQMPKMIIDINLSSSNFQDQDQFVKIYSFYECILKLGMETKLNIN